MDVQYDAEYRAILANSSTNHHFIYGGVWFNDGFFAISLSWINDTLEKDSYNTIGHHVSSAFRTIMDENIHTMEAVLEQMRTNPRFLTPFLNDNREELLALVQDSFSNLRKQHGITHLYFHKANRVNFLRVHNPLEFGDQVNRHTLVEAQKKGELTSGIELGVTNTLTLRVVGPWIVQGETVGFIEFIKEILHIDLAIFLDKKVLDRSAWEKGMALLARSSDWQRYEDVVLSASTSGEVPPELRSHLYQNVNKIDLMNQEIATFLGFDHYHFVSDVLMPGMDGYAVCKKLKELNSTKDIPIIFVTAMGEEQFEETGFIAGGVDYVTKPIRPFVLRSRVKTHIDLKIKGDVEKLRIEHDFSEVKKIVTLSIGVATVIPNSNETPRLLLTMADKLLYEAKLNGRNQIRHDQLVDGASDFS